MTWTWRPTPTWTLKLARGDVDLTPHLLEWDVAYGCSFDAGSGQWTIQTATGSLVLDNRLRAFDLGSPAAIITSADVAVPQLVVLSLGAGGETLWQGAVILSASARLRGDAAVRWQLRGHYFQVFRSLVEWRQVDNSDVGSTPHELIRRVLRDAVDGDEALDVTSPASVWPDNIQFQDVTLAETGGAAWNRLGQSMGSIPFEDSNGLPGMSAMHKMAEGQQRDIPDSMRALDDSALHSAATLSLWSLDVVTRDFVAAHQTTLVTTGAQNETHAEAVRFDLPDDVIGVEWVAPQPTAAAGWTILYWRAYPSQDRTRADTVRCVIRKDDDMPGNPSGVRYIGRLLTPLSDTFVNIAHPPIDAAGLLRSRRQSTPPWVKRTANFLTAFYAMNRFVNEQKVTATLRYPLWAVAEADRLPTHISDRGGLLVPGSMSRYRIDADRQIDMITGLVHLEGSAVTEPTATISGVTYSGASNYTGWIELLPRDVSAFILPAAVHPVYGPTPLSLIPPTPILAVNGATVTVIWPETLGAVDIRRREVITAGIVAVNVIAEDEDGTVSGISRTYDHTPTADVPVWYSIRHPVSSGQWSDWAGPVTTERPPRRRRLLDPQRLHRA